MKDELRYTVVDGIKCYSPDVASDYLNYPDSGFDLTDQEKDSSFWVASRNRLFKRMVLNHLIHEGETKFFEVGCGTGAFIKQLVGNENIAITGSEIYLKGLKYAKKTLPNVNLVQLDVTHGALTDKFDIIAAFDVIEHIENDNAALSNMHKMLSKDGALIISVPQHMFLWSKLDEIVKHKRRYSRKDLLTKLKKNGFDINYTTSFVFVLFPLMLISRLLDKSNSQQGPDEGDLEKRTKFSGVLNWVFDAFMRIDEMLIRLNISLPFGGTLIVVAKKSS